MLLALGFDGEWENIRLNTLGDLAGLEGGVLKLMGVPILEGVNSIGVGTGNLFFGVSCLDVEGFLGDELLEGEARLTLTALVVSADNRLRYLIYSQSPCPTEGKLPTSINMLGTIEYP